MTLSRQQFGEIHSLLETQGGFTVNAHTGNPITAGISVAPRGNEHREPLATSTPDTLAQFHAANAERFVAPRNASLGGWRSDSHDVLDTPTVYKDTPGGHTAARRNMIWSGQEAAYDLSKGEEVMNPFHPVTRRNMQMEPHELADAGFGADPNDHVENRRRADWQMQQPEVQAWVNRPAGQGAHARNAASRSAQPRQKRRAS